jgi:hypothetical protein
MTISGQRLGKHIPVAMNMHAVGNGVFSMCYKQGTKSVEFCMGGCEDKT